MAAPCPLRDPAPPGGAAAAAAARVSHESGCFILLTKTDHRPFQATMKTAARQKRRRASVTICKQNKTRYDERAEGAALCWGSLQATLLDGGHGRGTRAAGKAAPTPGVPGMEPGPCIPTQLEGGLTDARLPNTVPAFRGHPCAAPAQGFGLQHFPETKNNRNTVALWAKPRQRGCLHPRPRVPHRAEPRMPHPPQGSD